MIDKNDPRLTDFVLGELSAAEGSEIQTAIESSPELASVVEEIRQTVGLLGAAYLAEEPLSLLDEQKAELAIAGRGVDSAESNSNPKTVAVDLNNDDSNPIRTGRRWWSIALAATLLGVLIGGTAYLNNSPMSTEVADRMERVEELSNEELKRLKIVPDENEQLHEIVEKFNQAVDNERFDEALVYSNKAQELATESPTAIILNEKSKLLERVSRLQLLRDSRESGFFDPTASGERAAMRFGQLPESEATMKGELGFGAGQTIDSDAAEVESSLADFDAGLTQSLANDAEATMRQRGGEAGGLGGGGGFGVPREMEPGKGFAQKSQFELFTFDGSTKTERSSSGLILDKLLDDVDGQKTDGVVEADQAGLGARSFGGDAHPPTVNLAVKDPNGPEDGDKKAAFVPNLSMIVPDAAKTPAPTSVAPVKPQAGGAQPANAANPTSDSPATSRFAGSALGDDMQRRGLADKAADSKAISGKELESKKSGEEQAWYRYENLGIKVEDHIVDEVRSRVMPVERTRTEERTRSIKLADGSTKEEKYQVQVPFTEQMTQNYTVQVPKQVLTLEPEKSRQLVEELAGRIDPNRKREFQLAELIGDNVRAMDKKKADNVFTPESKNIDLRFAAKLLNEFKADESNQKRIDSTVLLGQLNKSLAKRNAEVRRTKTWKRVKAIPNTTRLMVGDKDELDLTGMQANVQVDGFRARVLIDCFYYNDRGIQLEGNFKLRLPDDASLYYFAFGESAYDFDPKGDLAKEEFLGDDTQFISLDASEIRKAREDVWSKVKEAKMVPREKAAHAFRETVRRKVDPALVEWSGAGVFNAKVFPLAPHKLHRIVIGYDVNLRKSNGDLVYEFDLPEQVGQCRVDLNVQPIEGVEYRIEPDADPFEKLVVGVAQRRYRFDGPQKNGIRLTASKSPEVLLQSSHDQEGEFWGVQITPDLPVEQVAGNSQAIFLVDTSLSSNPDKFNVWLKLLESTLENNRDSLKQFGVVFFNVEGHFWQNQYTDNTKENVADLMTTCETLALEGATDLYGAIEKVTQANWVYGSAKAQAARPTSGPDLFLLSDGAANWGETNLRLISRQLSDHQLGSLFAYQTGLTGTAISELRFLAGQSGGAVFSVATEDEIKTASTAHRKRPWKLETISVAGATDVMTAGRVQWVYPGQTINVVGRGQVDDIIELNLVQAAQSKSISISPTRVQSELASRLYGQVAVGQLESLGAKVFDVAASYARHFRVTGDTCSLLMLESEAEYKRFDIKPQEDLFVIKTKAAKDLVAETLKKSASEMADPKAQLVAWLQRLETMPGMNFKMPTAFSLVLDEIQIVPVSKPLDGSLTRRNDLSKEYLTAIQSEQLDYALIATEAKRRGASSVDDAIKVFSSLVERNPGDLVIARDVAFTAMELGRPAQAYHLLRNVARARPFEGSIYPALGQCLAQLGQSDMAIVYYEIALGGTFQRQGNDFKQIVSAEYMHLLRRIVSGDLDSSVKDFAAARLETLSNNLNFNSADLLITMMWNTDQTDVDLHITEPSGEECSYENKTTRSGGQITSDITTGFGPEMYSNPNAPTGKYGIQVKYFGNDQNRTALRNKVHLTIYRGFGTENERVTRKTIQLNTVGEKESVATVGVEK